jgi:formylglycine-generating enzyme required for sulfatase activity
MVSFEAGTATLGGGGSDGRGSSRQVHVDAFAIDRHEVTNGQYRLCVRANRCLLPLDPAWAEKTFDELDDRLPVINVTVAQAAVLCRWLGRRLPTEAEWERAARGSRGRVWPWGRKRPRRGRVNVLRDRDRPPPLARVDDPAFAGGETPEGMTHLVGNVREFTSTPLRCRPSPYTCATRWSEDDPSVMLASRGGGTEEGPKPLDGRDVLAVDATAWSGITGFRCARSR